MEGSYKNIGYKNSIIVLQPKLRGVFYQLEESAFDCVAKKLNYKTGIFLKQIKGEQNGKRRAKKKAETWTKLTLYPHEITKNLYDHTHK